MIGIIFGFIFIALGLATMLKSAGLIEINLDFGLILWALFFLFIGLKLIIKPKKNRSRFWSWKNSPCSCENSDAIYEQKNDNQKF
ncbi:MAG: hypothetical protein WCX23_02325 [Candidatus Paceibacterota bacterium]|jgi:hypothetical protein|nr:hypothetical protein [Candidatus Paceibacterota bacterium]MDD4831208.1 hypothetical protein [Candidatus Paceibacterota bacterium]MDD4875103.1 hypothetical protein [Candidatus Paceibacterota bacterium]